MIIEGMKLLSRKETIMVIGESTVFEQLFKIMAEKEGYDITVIVVDTCPSFTGRALVQMLSNFNIKCKYTLLNGIGCLLSQTTKIFIGANYVLGNGGIVSCIGSSMVAFLASQFKVPVIVWCETYKFTERVNLD